jgi:hypothetical protein
VSGGCDGGDARVGGSSGRRPVTCVAGAGSVGGRDGAGAGVPASVNARGGCDGDFGGIVTTARRPGGLLPVRGGWLPVRGGWLPVRGVAMAVRGGDLPRGSLPDANGWRAGTGETSGGSVGETGRLRTTWFPVAARLGTGALLGVAARRSTGELLGVAARTGELLGVAGRLGAGATLSDTARLRAGGGAVGRLGAGWGAAADGGTSLPWLGRVGARPTDGCVGDVTARGPAPAGGVSDGMLGLLPVSVDSSALHATSSGAISRIERHTAIAWCVRPWSRYASATER